MNYTELVAQLQDWVESEEADFFDAIPDMIIQAENRIYKSIDFAITRDEAVIAMVSGTPTVSLPTTAGAETITVRQVQLVDGTGVRTQLYQKDISYIDEFTGNRTTTGVPRYYAVIERATASPFAMDLLLGPTPNSTDNLHVHRTIRPEPLSATLANTWLGDTYPELLLYSCLLEVATYHRLEPDTMQDYQAKYQEALQSVLVEENHRNRFDRARHGEIGIKI